MQKSMNAQSIGGPSVCRRNLNVESAVDQFDDANTALVEAVNVLEDVLKPLLGPERPVGIGEDRQKGDSEVAERILSGVDRLRAHTARIHELIDRL